MSEDLCGKCGRPMHPYETRRYFGSYVAHEEYRCLSLLLNEIITLRAELATAERRGAERALRWAWNECAAPDEEAAVASGIAALFPATTEKP